MKTKLAKILRYLADKLDRQSSFENLEYWPTASTSGGVVVEAEGRNLWHPDQHGNVIEVEPDLIRQARRNGTLH